MNFIETEIKGLWMIEPKIIGDSRGYFMETYKKSDFESHIGNVDFIQDNESQSSFGVLRGLHFQSGDTAQAKLVRVTTGCVWDVALDVRENSPTYGQFRAVELSAENKRQFFIPRGFAHGFVVLSEIAVFNYKVDNPYSPATEVTINCLDPELNIPWPVELSKILLSDKDKLGTPFNEIII
ncbi:MAG: dTDP-4-dehydrorhamnose 3,5-epimerase [Dysgonamonadaceae bacterium]|jgi:dTDP-4-dehydrorhamnose 3,5-epimerase|nr:dTDP-4-dehydrorhamnose 3,5-epimerase [Dysgonamonadaceae bacterium]